MLPTYLLRFQILKGLYFSGVAPIPPDILHYDNILWRPTLAATPQYQLTHKLDYGNYLQKIS